MIRKKIRITLKTDVVITANSATQGEHKTLDYIPGSLLRGYAIANIGGDFKPELFFSGKVRFHNAYPIANNGDFTTPIPNSFHRLKITNANGNDTPIIYNGALQMPAEQTEQMRNNCLAQISLYFTALANGNSKMYYSGDMIRCVENAGLQVDTIHDGLGLGHSIIVCKKK